MNITRLSVEHLNLNPIGADNGQAPETALHGQLIIANGSFHVTAIQVREVGGGVFAPVDGDYTAEVEALYTLSGDSLTTVEIDGRKYLLAVYPHSS